MGKTSPGQSHYRVLILDSLIDEKKRGMTIDLGFAFFNEQNHHHRYAWS
jgi:Selenocysteine-specific translation elongation factor